MKTQIVIRGLIGALVGALMLYVMLTFQVRQNERVVLTRFGKPVRVLVAPGLYAKWPWPIETVNRFDARLDFYDARISEALTRDKRNVIIPVYVAWRIEDPLKFLQSLGSAENARNKLDGLVTSARNTVLGGYDFNQLVSTNRDEVKIPEIEHTITDFVAQQAKESFGIAIEQVGIKRLTLPQANTQFVFERMRAERAQFAAQYRAEGQQQADEVRAKTDADKTVILADARKYAEETRGKGEAEAARIYRTAHEKDPSFYRFIRELDALKQITATNTTVVLDTATPPFDLLHPALKGE
ncbi:MAG TPA: protease modulator HflC [Verrucomicrobiae bacterium]|nr:protease modulator HflC [Verrucomicrobiae bacterium]